MKLATLGLIAILLAGCATDLATQRPVTSLPVRASPSPVVTAKPTPSVTAQPVTTCPPEPSAAELVLQLGPSTESIDLDSEPLPAPEAVAPEDVPIVATVLGGIDHAAEIALDQGRSDDLAITKATADFVPFGTTSTTPVKAAVSDGSLALVLPNAATAGQLRISVSWSSSCGDGSGSGSFALAVVKASVGEGCPAAGVGYDADLAALDGQMLRIGTLDVPMIVTGWSGRWVPGAGASDVPEFAGWDGDKRVIAAPDDRIVVSESVDDLSMLSIHIAIYRRADVDAYLEPDSTDTLDTLTFVRRDAGPKGRASIPAPLETGKYVVEVVGSWLTSCLSVETYSAFSLEVR